MHTIEHQLSPEHREQIEQMLRATESLSQEGYGAARRFYRACAYDEAAVLREFYRPGEDLIIFTKSLCADAGRWHRRA